LPIMREVLGSIPSTAKQTNFSTCPKGTLSCGGRITTVQWGPELTRSGRRSRADCALLWVCRALTSTHVTQVCTAARDPGPEDVGCPQGCPVSPRGSGRRREFQPQAFPSLPRPRRPEAARGRAEGRSSRFHSAPASPRPGRLAQVTAAAPSRRLGLATLGDPSPAQPEGGARTDGGRAGRQFPGQGPPSARRRAEPGPPCGSVRVGCQAGPLGGSGRQLPLFLSSGPYSGRRCDSVGCHDRSKAEAGVETSGSAQVRALRA
jgi:hypothetical protein